MSLREVDRLKFIQAVTEGFLTPTRAAQRLQLSTRQVHRLIQRYRDAGVSGLTSRKRGQPSNHQLRPGLEPRAANPIRAHDQDFGPTLAAEKLAECHGLRLAKETVRRIMINAGLWTPSRQRPPKVYQPRNRRACLGELIQIDGSAIGVEAADAAQAAELKRCYVYPALHGTGAASALIKQAVGCYHGALRLTVADQNLRAQAFCKKHGFVVVGETQFLCGNDVHQDLVMLRLPPKQ